MARGARVHLYAAATTEITTIFSTYTRNNNVYNRKKKRTKLGIFKLMRTRGRGDAKRMQIRNEQTHNGGCPHPVASQK